MSSAAIDLVDAVARRLRRHAERAWPEEACGLLIGRHLDGAVEILDSVATANRSDRPLRRFDLDPLQLLDLQDGLPEGSAVVGVYHSHPVGDPSPSPADRATASRWAELVHVFVPMTSRRALEPVVYGGSGRCRAGVAPLVSSAGS